jgi:GTP cyclohydrolase I
VRALLVGLGEDDRREGLRRRVAKAFRDGTRGYKLKIKDIVQGALFSEVGVDKRTGYAGGTGGQAVVRDIDLFSYCESCFLSFSIQCHIGYVPSGGRVVGLSKLSRIADVFTKRFQNPQRLANEVCGEKLNFATSCTRTSLCMSHF